MTVGAPVSVGKVVVGKDELGTVSGSFEFLAGSDLGTAANFGAASGTSYVKICAGRFGTDCSFRAKSSGSPPACGE